MIYNIIYFILFFLIVTIIFWILEDKAMESFGTKMVEIDGQQFLIPDYGPKGKDPKIIKSTGSVLACESLKEITGQRVKLNREVPGAKSVVSGKPILVDCHDIKNNIMVDYKSREFYTFNGPDHINEDIYEFYDRWALDTIKKETINNIGFKYIEIPYMVDNCSENQGVLECHKNIPMHIRKERIKNYLQEKIISSF
jgi:hypothetical protein